MPSPLVSIVIDNFNYERYLPQSIDSALAQTYARVEVIVVDDVSTDRSRVIIDGYADRIIPVLQSENRGQGAAFNAGFLACSGDIVMFLDADDWLYPQAVQRIVAAWRPGQSKVHFRLDLVDELGVKIDIHPAPEVRLDTGDVVPLMLEFGRYETVVTSGNAFARAALAANLPMPEEPFRIAADGYLVTVVPFHGPVATIEECLGAYRVHGANAYASTSGMAVAFTAGAPAPSGVTAAQLAVRARKFLDHDAHKDRVLRAKAESAGFRIDASPQLKDPSHLEMRLASVLLDPGAHPHPGDRRTMLALRGMAASRRARLSWRRRSVLAVWFLIVGFFPKALALRAIKWKILPATRPVKMKRNMKRLRRLLS
jgi:hypothetical protein